jgi:hypothetical protein
MRKLIAIVVMAAMLTSCVSSTEYGKCIGIADSEKPTLDYTISWWNLFWGGFVSLETVVIPVITVLFYAKCPSGKVSQESTK